MSPEVRAAVEGFEIKPERQGHPIGIGQINSSEDVINPCGWLTNKWHRVGRLDGVSTNGELLWIGHRLGGSPRQSRHFQNIAESLEMSDLFFLWVGNGAEQPRLRSSWMPNQADRPLSWLGFLWLSLVC